MVFNTLSVATAVTPAVLETYVSHYTKRSALHQKPTAHISYHEGLRLIREFLSYSSKHTVEDLQNFTAQWVPCPSWVRINDAEVAPKFLDRAAELLRKQLGPRGLEMIGGNTWWQWRRNGGDLRAEWIEMKKEYHERKRTGAKCERVILYVHGGAYYFGSVDEHRYQMQRHARKLKARVLSPRYRLAPQFPFPCGLYDCLATYFYLLEHFYPSQILFAGDSAGAGMVLSMLVTLRDQGQPLPAGTILLSPWVDLTHSFPSVAGNGSGDYIPSQGFHHRPSMAWPPPKQADKTSLQGFGSGPEAPVELPATAGLDMDRRRRKRRGSDVSDDEDGMTGTNGNLRPSTSSPMKTVPQFGAPLKINIDGRPVELEDQIQLYTTNALLAHPLVSPIMQPSLGGLPPMLIQTGGAELLKDEQIFLAHKAANPAAYPPNESIMREFDPERKALDRWPPTDVQVQVWEDLCHVPQTLSFTRPAKYMYRSISQFGAWALARAQQRAIAIPSDDALSIISSGEEEETDDEKLPLERSESSLKRKRSQEMLTASKTAVGKAGDALPPFKNHMIRQRVTRHGVIYPMAPASELACLALDPAEIGVPKAGPVRKWLAAREAHDVRFSSERKKVDKKRAKEIASGYDTIPGENPPLTALVNRRRKGIAPEEKKKGRSWGLAMWSGWGSNHDEQTLQREVKNEKRKGSVERSASGHRPRAGSDGDNHLDVPKEEKEGRRSSVGARLPIPWSSSPRVAQGLFMESTSIAPRQEVVVDAGQTSEEHNQTESAQQKATSSNDITNSQSSKRFRPMSSSFSSPIPIGDEAKHRRQESRNAREAPIAVIPEVPAVPIAEERNPEASNALSHNQPTLPQAAASQSDSAVLQEPVELETPHLELPSDPFDAVELSAIAERDDNGTTEDELSSRLQGSESNVSASASSETTPEQGSASTFEAFKRTEEDEAVSPVDSSELTLSRLMDEVLISPIEEPTQQKWPFKLRNPVFDHRTSMLGSIGADGMPNAHYAFLPRSATITPEPIRSDENKPPFKLRSTVYKPEPMLDTLSNNSPPGENDTSRSHTSTSSSHFRESGALGMSMNGLIVGDQSDRPVSYVDGPTTNVTMPQPIAKRPLAQESAPNVNTIAEDQPPPPPPKDEKPLTPKGKVTGLRKPIKAVNSVESLRSINRPKPSGSEAPVIGDLSFERPQLESFVTASEGKDLQMM